MIGLLAVAIAANVLSIPAQAQSRPLGLEAAAAPSVLCFPPQGQAHLIATTGGAGAGSDWKWTQPGQSCTILTVKGPAIIYRIWSTSQFTQETRLILRLDGTEQVVWEKGNLPAGQQPKPGQGADPLRAMDGQAYWSYVPIVVRQQAEFIAQDLRKPTPPTADAPAPGGSTTGTMGPGGPRGPMPPTGRGVPPGGPAAKAGPDPSVNGAKF